MSTLKQIIEGVRVVGEAILTSVDAPPAGLARMPRVSGSAASVDDCSKTKGCLRGKDHEGVCILGAKG